MASAGDWKNANACSWEMSPTKRTNIDNGLDYKDRKYAELESDVFG